MDSNPNENPDESDILGTRIRMRKYIADSVLLISMTKVTLNNYFKVRLSKGEKMGL